VDAVKNETGGQLCAAGLIAKAFGIKGEVKIRSYSRGIEEFKALGSVLVGRNEREVVRREIEEVVARGEDLYIRFRDTGDRNAAEQLIGHFLFVEESDRRSLASGQYFVDDLVGLEVRNRAGRSLGTVKEVLSYPAHDVYVIRSRGTDVMVPAVREIVTAVDMKSRVMIIDPPEGLFGGTAL